MEPTALAQKVSKPTIHIAVFVLFLDVFSLLTIDKSPAYLSTSEIFTQLPVNLGYLSAIFTLSGLLIMLPVLMISDIANRIAFRLLTWPFRRSRILRVFFQFQDRTENLDLNAVKQFAMQTKNAELLERANSIERTAHSTTTVLPVLTLVLLTLMHVNSDAQTPNFFMKVCSLGEPVSHCGAYTMLFLFAVIQALILMAVFGFTSRNSNRFPKRRLNVSETEFKDHTAKTTRERFDTARRSWLGRDTTHSRRDDGFKSS